MDSEIKIEAIQYANTIYDNIIKALTDPNVAIAGESKKVYEQFKNWDFIEDYNILDKNNKKMYIKIIAMQQYVHLRWKKEKENDNKNKTLTKWEKVMGRVR